MQSVFETCDLIAQLLLQSLYECAQGLASRSARCRTTHDRSVDQGALPKHGLGAIRAKGNEGDGYTDITLDQRDVPFQTIW